MAECRIDEEGTRLVGSEFIPLPNFQPEQSDYRNTCFIAVVVNLRSLLPAINDVLHLNERSWKETITAVRVKWRQKYAFTLEFQGQDDAAELLGDILWEAPAYRWSCKKTTTFYECRHSTEMHHLLTMVVLSLPEQEISTSVSVLVKRFLEPEALCDLKHDDTVCGVCNQEGEATLSFQGVQPDTCVFRINRYTAHLERRADKIYPDPMLMLGGSAYSLRAGDSCGPVGSFSIPAVIVSVPRCL